MKITTFITESESIYQIDEENKKIRKLNFQPPSTTRITGDWKSFLHYSAIRVGHSVAIFWKYTEEKLSQSIDNDQFSSPVIPLTTTNLVKHIYLNNSFNN